MTSTPNALGGGPSLTYSFDKENSLAILHALEVAPQGAYTFAGIAAVTNIAKTTVRRYLKPEFWEVMSETRLLSYRAKLTRDRESSELDGATLAYTEYSYILGTATPIGIIDGERMYRVNTSKFSALQTIGHQFRWSVQWNPRNGRVEARRLSEDEYQAFMYA